MSKTIKIETPDGSAWVRVADIGAVTVRPEDWPLMTISAHNGHLLFQARYPLNFGANPEENIAAAMKDAAAIAEAIEREDEAPLLPLPGRGAS